MEIDSEPIISYRDIYEATEILTIYKRELKILEDHCYEETEEIITLRRTIRGLEKLMDLE